MRKGTPTPVANVAPTTWSARSQAVRDSSVFRTSEAYWYSTFRWKRPLACRKPRGNSAGVEGGASSRGCSRGSAKNDGLCFYLPRKCDGHHLPRAPRPVAEVRRGLHFGLALFGHLFEWADAGRPTTSTATGRNSFLPLTLELYSYSPIGTTMSGAPRIDGRINGSNPVGRATGGDLDRSPRLQRLAVSRMPRLCLVAWRSSETIVYTRLADACPHLAAPGLSSCPIPIST